MEFRKFWKLLLYTVTAVVSAYSQSPRCGEPQALKFTVLDKGMYSGIVTQRFAVIRDEATFRLLWSEHTAGRSPAPPVPPLDFSNEMVIAAFAGTKNTAGYTIKILGVASKDQRLEISLQMNQPGPDCMLSQVLTQPYVVAKTKKVSDPAHFNLSTTTSPCEGGVN